LADLPMAGKPVREMVLARRFHCDVVLCGRRILRTVRRGPAGSVAGGDPGTTRMPWSTGRPR